MVIDIKKRRMADKAATFIGEWLIRYFRVPVRQYKEKFGDVRVYCDLGFADIYSILAPSSYWIPTWWPYKLDKAISSVLMPVINFFVVPLHRWAYRFRYKQAVKKWPKIRHEILCCADYHDLLRGL